MIPLLVAAQLVAVVGGLWPTAALAGSQTAIVTVTVTVPPNCRADSTAVDASGVVTVQASCIRGTVPAAQPLPLLPIPEAATNVTWTQLPTDPVGFDKWTLTYNS
jgi:hypothetical protein